MGTGAYWLICRPAVYGQTGKRQTGRGRGRDTDWGLGIVRPTGRTDGRKG